MFEFKSDNKNVNKPSFCPGSISNGFSATEPKKHL